MHANDIKKVQQNISLQCMPNTLASEQSQQPVSFINFGIGLQNVYVSYIFTDPTNFIITLYCFSTHILQNDPSNSLILAF